MHRDYHFYVYIMASDSGTLYIGVTGNLQKRIWQHNHDALEGFTKKYQCHKLVYYEHFDFVKNALRRETQLKTWSRKKKEQLIKIMNPHWRDLADGEPLRKTPPRDSSTSLGMTQEDADHKTRTRTLDRLQNDAKQLAGMKFHDLPTEDAWIKLQSWNF